MEFQFAAVEHAESDAGKAKTAPHAAGFVVMLNVEVSGGEGRPLEWQVMASANGEADPSRQERGATLSQSAHPALGAGHQDHR